MAQPRLSDQEFRERFNDACSNPGLITVNAALSEGAQRKARTDCQLIHAPEIIQRDLRTASIKYGITPKFTIAPSSMFLALLLELSDYERATRKDIGDLVDLVSSPINRQTFRHFVGQAWAQAIVTGVFPTDPFERDDPNIFFRKGEQQLAVDEMRRDEWRASDLRQETAELYPSEATRKKAWHLLCDVAISNTRTALDQPTEIDYLRLMLCEVRRWGMDADSGTGAVIDPGRFGPFALAEDLDCIRLENYPADRYRGLYARTDAERLAKYFLENSTSFAGRGYRLYVIYGSQPTSERTQLLLNAAAKAAEVPTLEEAVAFLGSLREIKQAHQSAIAELGDKLHYTYDEIASLWHAAGFYQPRDGGTFDAATARRQVIRVMERLGLSGRARGRPSKKPKM